MIGASQDNVPGGVQYECGKEYVTDESLAKVQKIFKEKGSNAWFDLSTEELMPENAKCPACGCTTFKKETDIMDVWFDSGSTHESVLAERGLPEANLYLEGSDQYRGWFQSSLLTSVATKGKAPYKEVLTHGYTVDEQGRKMSKSIGNGIDPKDLIKEFGADIVRLWVLSSDYKSDVSISKGIMKQVAEVYRKIRNTARYILGNIYDLDVKHLVEYHQLEEIDQFALIKLNHLIEECTKAFEEYDFNKAYQAINSFCVVDMSNFYLDIIKDRLYTSKKDSIKRRAAQTTMYEILSALVRLIAPMTSYTAEEIWKYMPHQENDNQESIMLANWPKINKQYENQELEEKWNQIIKIKEEVAKALEVAREEKQIGHSLNAKVILYVDKANNEFLKGKEELLKEVFIVSAVELKEAKEFNVKVEVADGQKCERCWMYSTTVGEDKQNPTICHKCSEALKE